MNEYKFSILATIKSYQSVVNVDGLTGVGPLSFLFSLLNQQLQSVQLEATSMLYELTPPFISIASISEIKDGFIISLIFIV